MRASLNPADPADRAAVKAHLDREGAVGPVACPATFLRGLLDVVTLLEERIRDREFELGRAVGELALSRQNGKHKRFGGWTLLQLAQAIHLKISTGKCLCPIVGPDVVLAPQARCTHCQYIREATEEFNRRQEDGLAAAVARNACLLEENEEPSVAYKEGLMQAVREMREVIEVGKISGGPGNMILEP